jgi:predicted DNA-binding transcriptional regulator AlpA
MSNKTSITTEQHNGAEASLPHGLTGFGQLPDEAHVDVKIVCGIIGIAEPTAWTWLRNGRLPKPRKFGRATRWNVGELRKFVAGGAQ